MVLDFFFFNDTATTEIYTLSLHDALPICRTVKRGLSGRCPTSVRRCDARSLVHAFPRSVRPRSARGPRSEEHTSELQSRQYLVCRLLLEKKKNQKLLYGYSNRYTTPHTNS